MRLFHIPGACSFGPHAALRELGRPFVLERVRFVEPGTRQPLDIMAPGARLRPYDLVYGEDEDFRRINPKGLVPTLELDGGAILTEGVAIYLYLGDLQPERMLVPPVGSPRRALFVQYAAEIAQDIHKGVSLAMHGPPGEERDRLSGRVVAALQRFSDRLGDRPYLLGEFSLLDIYLFMNWRVASGALRRPLASWPHAATYVDRLRSRPCIRLAAEAEGMQARFLAPAKPVGA